MSQTCMLYEDLILRLPDGDLSDNDVEDLREHLQTCADCRRVFRAMQAASADLETVSEPPRALAAGVMRRIAASEAKAAAEQAGAPDRVKLARRKRMGLVAAVAACFLLVIGGGSYLATHLLGFLDASRTPSVERSATLESAAVMEAAPAPEPAGAEYEEAYGEPTLDAGTEEEAPAAAAAVPEEETALGSAADAVTTVPEGNEPVFEAMLQDAGGTTPDPDALSPVVSVEYRGVIYEFLTDAGGQSLYWRDAAESVDAILSPATVDNLWTILG